MLMKPMVCLFQWRVGIWFDSWSANGRYGLYTVCCLVIPPNPLPSISSLLLLTSPSGHSSYRELQAGRVAKLHHVVSCCLAVAVLLEWCQGPGKSSAQCCRCQNRHINVGWCPFRLLDWPRCNKCCSSCVCVYVSLYIARSEKPIASCS